MRFIKLSTTIINTSHITKIVNRNNKYHIYMTNNYINGYMFLNFGSVSTEENLIEVCKVEDPIDYVIMREWTKMIDTGLVTRVS